MEQTICIMNATIFTGIMSINSGAIIVQGETIVDVVGKERLEKLNLPDDTLYIDVQNNHVSAGFIDTHIHGCGGFDTSSAEESASLHMSKFLPSYGVTSFCPTIYTQKEDRFNASMKGVIKAMGWEEGAHIEGLHLEGPFISRSQMGAQDEAGFKEVSLELMEQYIKLGRGKISLMTVAPELKNMRDLALYCIRQGITLSAGHTHASYENMLEGMQTGILHSTHFFNAMRILHHRDPGCVGAILIHPEISCEIIADGQHVHPALIKLLHRDKPVDKIVLITDSLGPTGQKSGPFFANNEEVYIKDSLFYKKSDDVIAGSCLTMMEGVKNLVSWGIPLEDAVLMATANPSRVIGIDKTAGMLIPGHRADITCFSQKFETQFTMVSGKIVYQQ